jgi:hypothetical protein
MGVTVPETRYAQTTLQRLEQSSPGTALALRGLRK